MNSIILEELKNKLNKIEKKEKEIKEKTKVLKELNTQKLYLRIWKYILSNLSKEEFKIYIYTYEDLGNKDEYVTMIKVNKMIKKIMFKNIDLDYFRELLKKDGLTYKYRGSLGDREDTPKFEISITRYMLKTIIEKDEKEKQKTLK